MSATLQGWLGFRSFRMRFVLTVWVTFRGVSSHVFKQSYAMAAELIKVPLEIFFNPTILSGGGLFWVGRGDFCRPKDPASKGPTQILFSCASAFPPLEKGGVGGFERCGQRIRGMERKTHGTKASN